jgi:hypothetical protein
MRARLALVSPTNAVVVLALLVAVPLEIRAQCPDGSPPPCGQRRAPYVSRSTRRLPDLVRVLYDRAAERSGRIEDPSRHAAIFVAAAAAQLGDTARAVEWLRAYTPREDLHFQLHLKREPALRWVARVSPQLLAPAPPTAEP